MGPRMHLVDSASQPSFDPRRTLAGKHILVTGVTGFLGKVWLSWLLHTVPEVGQVTVLVRPRPGQTPLQRFARIADTSPCFRPLRERHGDDWADFLRQRITVVRGHVEKPQLGLGPAVVERLRGRVDAVIHCAGLTDFEGEPGKMVAVNTRGAEHAAQLASALGARHVHVSTCFVAGYRDGLVPEQLLTGQSPNGSTLDVDTELRALEEATHLPDLNGRELKKARVEVAVERAKALGWPNVYTYTKGMGEHLVRAVPGLDATIVRPAILECARAYPFLGWNEGLNTSGPLSWLIATAFRHLPAKGDHNFDVVPIDDAARALTLALVATLDGNSAGVYQIAASDHNPLTFDRTIELNGLAVRKYTRQQGASGWSDWLLQHMDPVSSTDGGPLSVPRVRRFARFLGRVAHELDEDELLGATARKVNERMQKTDRSLRRIEEMLRIYKPFISELDYTFSSAHLRQLTDALPASEREAFGYDLSDLDWCHYWVDVEYPGLMTWSIPILHGDKPPEDPASVPPLSLEPVASTDTSARVVGQPR